MIRVVLLLLLTGPAAAEHEIFDPAIVDVCFAEATDRHPACIGEASKRCQSETLGGYTVTSFDHCVFAEAARWDILLNEEYRQLRARLTTLDAASPVGLRRVDALREAQRAWIAFRDAHCQLEWSVWHDTAKFSRVGPPCLMTVTAVRTFDLRSLRAELLP